jgi:hypothetical protein
MKAYLNLSDFSHALIICKSYKKNTKELYSIDDYMLAKKYCSDFMIEIWAIVKECKVSLKEAFTLIRYNTMSVTNKVLTTLEAWLKPVLKTLTPKAISQLLRAKNQQAAQDYKNDLTIKVKVKRYWNRQEHRFFRQSIIPCN